MTFLKFPDCIMPGVKRSDIIYWSSGAFRFYHRESFVFFLDSLAVSIACCSLDCGGGDVWEIWGDLEDEELPLF